MYYYCYKITNIINNKIYLGVHKTINIDDGYMGSGSMLKKAFIKYGITNFSKEILQFFNCSEDMYTYEKAILTSDLIKSNTCYNIKLGGLGGFDYLNSTGLNNSTKSKELMSINGSKSWLTRSEESKIRQSKKISETMKKKHLEGKIPHLPNIGFTGRKHTAESKLLMSTKLGLKNSQFGTKWINKGGIDKKVKQNDLQNYLMNNWVLGRVKK